MTDKEMWSWGLAQCHPFPQGPSVTHPELCAPFALLQGFPNHRCKPGQFLSTGTYRVGQYIQSWGALQLLGDAYVQVEEYGKAAKAFEKAAKSGNDLIAPMSLKKAGLVYLEMGNKSAAKKAFETIKADYPAATEAQDIEKYIAIAE